MNYDNTNRGVLFRNEDKKTESHPDYRGSINVDGTEFWLSAWINESKKDGKKYMSLRVSPKEAREEAPKTQSDNMQPKEDFDDDLPF